MSLKFLSRLRDKDKASTDKAKLVHRSRSGDPRSGFDATEVQVISWNAESNSTRPLNITPRSFGSVGESKKLNRTPVYEAFATKKRDERVKSRPATALAASERTYPSIPTPSPSARSPTLLPKPLPDAPAPRHAEPAFPMLSGDTVEELDSTVVVSANPEDAPTNQSSKRNRYLRKKRQDASSSSVMGTSSHGGPLQRSESSLSSSSSSFLPLATVSSANELARRSRGIRESFSLTSKPSMRFLKRTNKQPSDPVPIPGDNASATQTQAVTRHRSSSMTSLTPSIAGLRQSERSNTAERKIATSSGHPSTPQHAPTSWKNAPLSEGNSPYLVSAYTSETDLSSAGDHGSNRRSKAKGAIVRARSIRKTMSGTRVNGSSSPVSDAYYAGLTTSTGSSGTSEPPSPELRSRDLQRDVGAYPSVKAGGAPPSPVVAIPIPTSPGKSNQSLLVNLMASQIFKQLGPPPAGMDASAAEERVSMVVDYIESHSIASTTSEEALRGEGAGLRKSLPPPSRQANQKVRSGLSAAAVSDAFDKFECQMEREMLNLLTRGACEPCAIEELRLDSIFLEARRRCGVDSSRTHFQLFENTTSIIGQGLTREGRFGSEGPALSVSPPSVSVISENPSQMPVDTLTGLGIPLRPAPRRKRRPTTAPESKSPQRGLDRLDRQTPSPPRLNATSESRPLGWKVQRSQAPTFRPFPGSDDSHQAGTIGLGFEAGKFESSDGDRDRDRAPMALFTPQSFSARAAPSSYESFAARNPSLHSARLGSPPGSVIPAFGSQHSSLMYRRGSDDRESNSSHTTRSVRSPVTSYGRLSSRMSGGTRNSQDTTDTLETSESTLAGGMSQMLISSHEHVEKIMT